MKYLLILAFLAFAPIQSQERAFICMGNAAYAYHTHSDCHALARCSRQIIETSLDSAKNHFSRTKFCGFCKYR